MDFFRLRGIQSHAVHIEFFVCLCFRFSFTKQTHIKGRKNEVLT